MLFSAREYKLSHVNAKFRSEVFFQAPKPKRGWPKILDLLGIEPLTSKNLAGFPGC